MKSIEFLKIVHLRGPNMWTYRPVLEAWVDIGDLDHDVVLLAVLLEARDLAAAKHGFHGAADGFDIDAQGRRLLNIQTSEYGAVFDVEKATFIRYGKIDHAPSYRDAATQDNALLDALPPASLTFTAANWSTAQTVTIAAAGTKSARCCCIATRGAMAPAPAANVAPLRPQKSPATLDRSLGDPASF